MTVMETIKPALIQATRLDETATIQDPQSCLRKILDAIDVVILPRDVTLSNGAGQTLSMTVKSRRLIRIEAAGLSDMELGEGQHDAICDVFAHFAAAATALDIKHAAPTRPESLSELGIPVAALRGAFIASGRLPSPNPAAVIPTLNHLAETKGLNWARFQDGRLTASQGDTDMLHKAHDTALPHILKTEKPGPGQAASWILGSGPSAPIAMTLEENQCFIAALPSEMIQTWMRISAGEKA